MKNQEKLVVYNDGRKVNIDGRYYIVEEEKEVHHPEERQVAFFHAGKYFVSDCILYSASGKKIISGDEIFGEDKQYAAGIRLRFIGPNTFIAFAVGHRENMILYIYRISDGKPEYLYKVYGGDCSFLVGEERPKISQDGLISVAYEITGTYDRAEVGEMYMVLRFMGNIIKEYPVGFKGEIYPLYNGRWLEVTENRVDLYFLWENGKIIKLKSVDYESSAELLFQDDFLIVVRGMGETRSEDKVLSIYGKYTLDWLKMLLPDFQSLLVISLEELISLGESAFYLDPSFLSSKHPVVRIEEVKRKDICSIESSPRGQYVIVETKEGIFVYEYTKNKLSNRQMIDKRHSFCFRQENCFTRKTNLNNDLG